MRYGSSIGWPRFHLSIANGNCVGYLHNTLLKQMVFSRIYRAFTIEIG
jgi:hypothetical protein